jgi:hypothetical protein
MQNMPMVPCQSEVPMGTGAHGTMCVHMPTNELLEQVYFHFQYACLMNNFGRLCARRCRELQTMCTGLANVQGQWIFP